MKRAPSCLFMLCFLAVFFCWAAEAQQISDETEAAMSPKEMTEEGVSQKMEEYPYDEGKAEEKQQRLMEWGDEEESKMEDLEEGERLDRR